MYLLLDAPALHGGRGKLVERAAALLPLDLHGRRAAVVAHRSRLSLAISVGTTSRLGRTVRPATFTARDTSCTSINVNFNEINLCFHCGFGDGRGVGVRGSDAGAISAPTDTTGNGGSLFCHILAPNDENFYHWDDWDCRLLCSAACFSFHVYIMLCCTRKRLRRYL
jgi:hypothetical protein